MRMSYRFDVHGYWIIGSILLFAGVVIAANIKSALGSTPASLAVSAVLSLLLIAAASLLWLTSAYNTSKKDLR